MLLLSMTYTDVSYVNVLMVILHFVLGEDMLDHQIVNYALLIIIKQVYIQVPVVMHVLREVIPTDRKVQTHQVTVLGSP